MTKMLSTCLHSLWMKWHVNPIIFTTPGWGCESNYEAISMCVCLVISSIKDGAKGSNSGHSTTCNVWVRREQEKKH